MVLDPNHQIVLESIQEQAGFCEAKAFKVFCRRTRVRLQKEEVKVKARYVGWLRFG